MAYYTEEAGRELREAFEQRTLHWPLVTVRRMFGCPAYLADGKLFAFLVSDGIVITQVRKHDRERLEATFSIAPFTAGEREIQRWVVVSLPDHTQLDRLMGLVKKSYESVLQN